MSMPAPEVLAERQRLAQALAANQADFASAIKLAQLEAAHLLDDPATLPRVAKLLDLALASLPVSHHPTLAGYVRDLHQKGVGIASVIQQGDFPRLKALLSGQAVPQNGTAPQAAPAQAPPAQAATQPHAVSAPAAAGSRIVVRDLDVGHPSNTKLKEFIDSGKLEELAASYAVLDNFRMRRVIIDKIAENKSQLALACLVKVLAHTTDAAISADVVKKAAAYDPAMLQAQLEYNPAEPKLNLASVSIMAAVKNEHVVEPLTQALGDPDPAVRAKAIEGLAEIIEASEEWISHLASTLRSEKDTGVRLACARALQTAGTPEALKALEAVVRDGLSDEGVKKVLDSWSSKNKSSSSAQLDKRKAKLAEEQKKGKAKKPAKASSGIHLDSQAIMMILVLVGSLLLIGVGAIMYARSLRPKLKEIPPEQRRTNEEMNERKANVEKMAERMRKTLGRPAAPKSTPTPNP